MTMRLIAVVLVALTLPGVASAKGGHFTVTGGTAQEQAQVRDALDVSRFDFDQLPTINVIIEPVALIPGGQAGAAKTGTVWLSSELLDWGPYSWGTVLHEFGHQVDYYLLNDTDRAAALELFGLAQWRGAFEHGNNGAEVFASSLSWAYWQSPLNGVKFEAYADARAFQKLLSGWGIAPSPDPVKVCTTHTVAGHWTKVHGKRLWIRRHAVTQCTLRP